MTRYSGLIHLATLIDAIASIETLMIHAVAVHGTCVSIIGPFSQCQKDRKCMICMPLGGWQKVTIFAPFIWRQILTEMTAAL